MSNPIASVTVWISAFKSHTQQLSHLANWRFMNFESHNTWNWCVKNKKINSAALEKIPQVWIVFPHAKVYIVCQGQVIFGNVQGAQPQISFESLFIFKNSCLKVQLQTTWHQNVHRVRIIDALILYSIRHSSLHGFFPYLSNTAQFLSGLVSETMLSSNLSGGSHRRN